MSYETWTESSSDCPCDLGHLRVEGGASAVSMIVGPWCQFSKDACGWLVFPICLVLLLSSFLALMGNWGLLFVFLFFIFCFFYYRSFMQVNNGQR